MKWNRLAISVGVVAMTLFGTVQSVHAQASPMDTVRVVGDTVKEGLKVVEELTTKQRLPTVKTFLGMAQSSAKLEVMKSDGQIIMEGEDEGLLGNNRVKIMVPCKFRYQIDLNELRAGDVQFDPSRMIVTVRMPPVRLDDPSPDRESMEILEQVNPTFRSSGSLQDLRDRVLAEQLKPRARTKGEESADLARNAGKAMLQKFLQQVYTPLMPDIRVFVE